MNYRERVQEIADVLAAVEGAGLVHPYMRAAYKGGRPDWGRFIDLFVLPATKEACGWLVSRRKAVPASPRWEETYLLQRFYGLRDGEATELDFQEHVNMVARRWRPGPGAAELTWGFVEDGLYVERIEEAFFGDVLCHLATCELRVSMYYDAL